MGLVLGRRIFRGILRRILHTRPPKECRTFNTGAACVCVYRSAAVGELPLLLRAAQRGVERGAARLPPTTVSTVRFKSDSDCGEFQRARDGHVALQNTLHRNLASTPVYTHSQTPNVEFSIDTVVGRCSARATPVPRRARLAPRAEPPRTAPRPAPARRTYPPRQRRARLSLKQYD